MPIYDHLCKLNRGIKKYTGDIGLEIETETKSSYQVPEFYFWHSQGDGSLRDFGVEYILKQPVKYGDELNLALDEWKDKTKHIKFIKDSISTSVHVHLNVLPESFKTLGNFLTLYCLLENILIRYSGPDRLSNLFCLPICDAEKTVEYMEHLFKGVAAKSYSTISVNEQRVKYAACNIATIGTYGSLEIRSFRGETSVEKIQKWIDILYDMWSFSKNPEITPRHIMDMWQKSNLDLLNRVFKPENRKEIQLKNEIELISKNTWYAATLAYSIKDWNMLDIEEKKVEFKPTSKMLNDEAIKCLNMPFNELGDLDKQYIIHRVILKNKTKQPSKETLPRLEVGPAVDFNRMVARERDV